MRPLCIVALQQSADVEPTDRSGLEAAHPLAYPIRPESMKNLVVLLKCVFALFLIVMLLLVFIANFVPVIFDNNYHFGIKYLYKNDYLSLLSQSCPD
jgi:hypothetical protein